MKYVKSVATAGLLFVALWLGFELRSAARERSTNQTEVAARKRELTALRTQLDAAKAARAAAAKLETEVAKASTAATAVAPTPEAAPLVDRRIADREKEYIRRNALHQYISGFERLHLPPALLAQAKAILLARAQATFGIRKGIPPIAAVIGEINRLNQVMEDQLTALLGAEATVELRSAARENSLDWTIGTDMWDAGTPLTPEQLRALARAEYQVRPQETHWAWETTEPEPDPQTGLTRLNADFIAATSRFLSPEQQATLQRSLVEDNQYAAAMRAFAEKQKKLSGTP